MSYIPKTVLLVKWPESQRIMEHPEAMAVDGDGHDVEPLRAYIVPPEVWEKYKDSYYGTERKDLCSECGLSDNLTWFSATKHSSYCDKCNCIICEECRSVRDPGDGDVIYCRDCVEEKED